MPSLDELVRSHTDLHEPDLEWLHRLVADWQILADFSFADLLLWVRDHRQPGYWSVAQMRPTTGPTSYLDDLVGHFEPRGGRAVLDRAWDEGRIVREGDPEWGDGVPVRVEAIPVRRDARLIAVLVRATNLLGVRTPSRLELAYLQTAADLTSMVSRGLFPSAGERTDLADAMRVGDGVVRADPSGTVTYVSPNAVSALRRLGLGGDLVGRSLAGAVREVLDAPRAPVEERVTSVLDGRQATEAEVHSATATLVLRAIPLVTDDGRSGAVILLRDVTELRRREHELMTREATIREIHHRVKNNLQTVAALLRLQARRVSEPSARTALEEAVQRVGAIAVVHELLSRGFEEVVDFDEVVDRLLGSVVDVAGHPRQGSAGPDADAVADTDTYTDAGAGLPSAPVAGQPAHSSLGSLGSLGDATAVRVVRRGSFGQVPADVATPLAVVLTELAQNAVEHGLPGRRGLVEVAVSRNARELDVEVRDDGVGLPPGFELDALTSLGLSIVRTLVCSELRGELAVAPRSGSGTRAWLRVPLTA